MEEVFRLRVKLPPDTDWHDLPEVKDMKREGFKPLYLIADHDGKELFHWAVFG